MKTVDAKEQYRRMLETPIPSLITRLAIPTVLGMLVTVVYNTADTYFVSQLNKSASAAVGAVYAVMAIIQAFGYGFGMGSGSLVSRMLGRKENDRANMYATSALFGSTVCGIAVAVLGLIFLEPLLHLLNCTETMLPHARPYARYILIAAPVACAGFVMNIVLRSEGDAATGMIAMSAGGILNIILDPIFIFTLKMGAGGAAVATALSQLLSFLILSYIYISGRSIVKIHLKYISRHLKDYGLIITTGLPTVFRQSLGSIAAASLTIQAVAYGGDAAAAAVTIANKVYVLVRNIVLGVGQAFQPVAGYNYGAGNRKRTWSAFRFSFLLGTGVCLICAAASAAFAGPIMRWFNDDAQVQAYGIRTIYFCSAVMPLMALSTYVNQLYQALGFRVQATFLASCRQGIFFLPFVYLLPLVFKCDGVLAAQPAADFMTYVVSVPFLIYFYLTKIREKEKI